MNQSMIRELLTAQLHADTVKIDEEMKRHTTFRIGGPASVFVEVADEENLVEAVKICRQEQVPFFILGNGSNLLVSDEGYAGVVLHIGTGMRNITVEDTQITAQAGAMLSQVAHAALEHSLTGMEFAAGIPGSLGGACMMNAGAYGGEMSQILISVRALNPDGEIVDLLAEQLDLGYRHSMMMEKNYIVLSAKIHLKTGDPTAIRARMDELKEQRTSKQPLDMPSAGSTFKRPEGAFAGKLIMDAGLRGYRVGDAMVSEKHCGFVVNAGHATAKDVCKLIKNVHDIVDEKFDKKLEPEIRFLGFDNKA